MLKRKRVVVGLIACLLCSLSTSVSAVDIESVNGKAVYHLRLAHSWGPILPIFVDAVENMVSMSEKMSGGRLDIEAVGSDVHGKPLRQLYNIKQLERAFEVEYIGHDKILTENYPFQLFAQ